MKKVFYRNLITGANELTATEKIVYSFLISKSITLVDSIFDCDGEILELGELYDIIEDCGGYIELFNISIRKLEKLLNISHQTTFNSISKLRLHGYISNDRIFVSKNIIDKGYFELHRTDKLTGNTLIFYSYLKDRASKFCGSIDTYRKKLAEIFNVKVYSIDQYLAKLHKLELVKRLDNGKLLIL